MTINRKLVVPGVSPFCVVDRTPQLPRGSSWVMSVVSGGGSGPVGSASAAGSEGERQPDDIASTTWVSGLRAADLPRGGPGSTDTIIAPSPAAGATPNPIQQVSRHGGTRPDRIVVTARPTVLSSSLFQASDHALPGVGVDDVWRSASFDDHDCLLDGGLEHSHTGLVGAGGDMRGHGHVGPVQ